MKPFYIDSCCKKTRVMLIVAGLLLAVIGSRFRIPWVLCSGPFAATQGTVLCVAVLESGFNLLSGG